MPPRRVPLAWRNLTESRLRLAAYLAGTAFAVVLMMVELGFRNALLDNMVAVIHSLDGDLFLTNRDRYMVSQPVTFPLRRLDLAKGAEGVASVSPLYLETERILWRNPSSGKLSRIRVIAFNPSDNLLNLPEIRSALDILARPDSALADRRSKAAMFGLMTPGSTSELSGRTLQIVGQFSMGTDFRNNGSLVMSEANFLRSDPTRAGPTYPENQIDLGVIRLQPGVPPETTLAAIRARLTPDMIVLTRAELIAKERKFWENVAPVGIIFNIGLVMGFIVGMAICYQVLYSEIADRLGQFATLKAMGYTDSSLRGFIVREGLDLSLLGYLVGLALSLVLFKVLGRLTGMDVGLYLFDLVLILALTVAMCVGSGFLAARRLITVDPADLFG